MPFDIPGSSSPVPRLPSASLRLRTFACVRRHWRLILTALFLFVLLLSAGSAWLLSPPSDFPNNSIVTLPEGAPAITLASTLKEAHIVRSARVFYVLSRLTHSDRSLETGAYVFTEQAWLPTVMWRIAHGQHGIEAIKITLPEGITRFGIAETLSSELPGFDAKEFLRESSTSEGYLFPETYLFMPEVLSSEVVLRLKSQFSASIATITPQIISSPHSFKDIVSVGSLLEREARTPEDMRIVAGIIWNRLAKGMPLQIDAAFGYIHKKDGYTPTAADLDSDSPYNTYRNKGLPPTPISNPGIEALLAAAVPAKTPYYYYLTGKDGLMHYAVTFEQHKKNRALYLDN